MSDKSTINKCSPKIDESDSHVQEVERLRSLQGKGFIQHFKCYFSMSGPGWMQSAMTLGGGSAMACLFSGAFLKYQLLWVQPVAMIIGIIMLSALSYQTLTRGERPFSAMKKYVHPSLAWIWVISTLITTLIWHFSQYAIASGVLLDILQFSFNFELKTASTSQSIALLLIAGLLFIIATATVWSYGKNSVGVKLFENVIKSMVWLITLAFLGVVITRSFLGDGIAWDEVLNGFIPFTFDGGFRLNIPTDTKGASIFIASLSAAVGLNMTFLFGYTFLKKGWTKEYIGLANFDLMIGMFVPYIIATSLMIIAAGSTLHTPEFLSSNISSISPLAASKMLIEAGLPEYIARLIFGFGIIGMAFNAITLHMIVSGFAICEVLNIPPVGWKYRIATLAPFPGVFGAILWSKMGTWIAIPVASFALIMLPLAYIGFFLLNNSSKYLKEDLPTGNKRFIWNLLMIVAIAITVFCVIFYFINVVPTYF